jgi:hypothetical protein
LLFVVVFWFIFVLIDIFISILLCLIHQRSLVDLRIFLILNWSVIFLHREFHSCFMMVSLKTIHIELLM